MSHPVIFFAVIAVAAYALWKVAFRTARAQPPQLSFEPSRQVVDVNDPAFTNPLYARVAYIQTYNFTSAMTRVARANPTWTLEMLHAARSGLRDFLILHLFTPAGPRGIPSALVNEAWYAFREDTIAYRTFCMHVFGGMPESKVEETLVSKELTTLDYPFSKDIDNTWTAATHCTQFIRMNSNIPTLFLLDRRHLKDTGMRWNLSALQALSEQCGPMPVAPAGKASAGFGK